ncbi:helix-turn-helix transcriptional regulator [Streptomyces sp. ASQP_92]|uniref:helix-turn-helix domain-containing protein n=1 Tax=Streptomyces sp. ASQP_92 TaxID=2979116 RepID=UPI0021C1C2AA|nr:helix-turn-helix transcriptional regulator [Streptomyces sp. ASQP_92]MCT9090612.1 helix-turn-helix transcriptional regulator [Streptomyces sp. ASQP_92]
MRRNEQERTQGGGDHVAEFGAWFEQRLTELGYDISRPRSGGRGKFAKDAGVSHATVSRILTRTSVPTPDVLATMAPHLGVSLGYLLVLGGKATADEVNRAAEPSVSGRRLTPEEAARQLGIDDQDLTQLFVTMAQQMQAQQRARTTATRAPERH